MMRWNYVCATDRKMKKIAIRHITDGTETVDQIQSNQAMKHFVFYDMASLKGKAARASVIAWRMGMDTPTEQLSFMVDLTAMLDHVIFAQAEARITNITIGGEGGYRLDVTDHPDYMQRVQELEATPGQAPWGISKSYEYNGLTIHTFTDMRWGVERFSTVFG